MKPWKLASPLQHAAREHNNNIWRAKGAIAGLRSLSNLSGPALIRLANLEAFGLRDIKETYRKAKERLSCSK